MEINDLKQYNGKVIKLTYTRETSGHRYIRTGKIFIKNNRITFELTQSTRLIMLDVKEINEVIVI